MTIFFAESEWIGVAWAVDVFVVGLAAGACCVADDFVGVAGFGCCAPATAAVRAVATTSTSALRASILSSNVESSRIVRQHVLVTVARAGRGCWSDDARRELNDG